MLSRSNIITLVFSVVAFLIGLTFSWPSWIVYKNELLLSDFIGYAVTIIIGGFLSLIFTKRNNESRIEKDFIIKELIACLTSVAQIEKLVNSYCDKGVITTNEHRLLTNSLSSLGKQIKYTITIANELFPNTGMCDVDWEKFLDFRKAVSSASLQEYNATVRSEVGRTSKIMRIEFLNNLKLINRH